MEFVGGWIREYVEIRLHLLLRDGESSLALIEQRNSVDDCPDEDVHLFHGLGVVNLFILLADVVFDPLDGCFDSIHVVRENDLQDAVGSPDVGHKYIGPA